MKKGDVAYLLLDLEGLEAFDQLLSKIFASVGTSQPKKYQLLIQRLHEYRQYELDEVQDDVANLAIVVPMHHYPQEHQDVGGGPPVDADVDAAGVCLHDQERFSL